MSRVVTLLIALLSLHLMLGTLSLVIGRGEHKSPALRWWGGGLLVYAAGLVWVVSGAFAFRALAVTGGNTLITASSVMCAFGVLCHTRFRIDRRLIAGGIFATAFALAVNNFGPTPDHGVNFAVPTVMGVVMFALGGIRIARRGPRESTMANRFLASIMIVAAILWTARVVVFYVIRGQAGDAQALDEMSSFFAIAQMLIGVAATLSLFWIDVRIMQAELSRVAHTDALTGLPNRRAIATRFDEEAARARRAGGRFAIAVFDLDHFKAINDAHGHTLGDEVLEAAAVALASAKRSEDVLARIGGEEFLVLLPLCDTMEGALQAADRMREAVATLDVRTDEARLEITTSAGVALYPDEGADWDTLFAVADRRLYGAKAAGRNRAIGADPPASHRPGTEPSRTVLAG